MNTNTKRILGMGGVLFAAMFALSTSGCSLINKDTGSTTSLVSDTIPSETLAKGGTYSKKGATYYITGTTVTGDLTFGPNVKVVVLGALFIDGSLTIQEGAKFYFDEDAYLEIRDGKLSVLGSDSLPVLFKNRVAGKNWGYGSSATYSGGIWFGSNANPSSVIQYAVVDSANTGIYVAVDGVEISNSKITNSKNYGVVWSAEDVGPKAGFAGNAFSGNGAGPFYIFASQLTRLDGSQTFAATDKNITVAGATVTASGKWSPLSVPYEVTGSVSLNNDAGVSIEILAGTHIVYDQGTYLDVQTSATLLVSGTTAKPVIMGPAETGKRWGYATSSTYSGAIWIASDASANTSIKHLQLDSANTGIYVNLDGIKIDSSSFSGCEFQSILFDGKSVPGSLKGNTYKNDGEYSLTLGFNALTSLDGSGTFTGATEDVRVLGATATNSGTIPVLPVAYLLTGAVALDNPDKAVTITLTAGSIFKMTQDAYFDVSENGGLIAVGTAAKPIIMENAVSGTTWGYGSSLTYCGGIWLNSNSTAQTHVSNVTFRGVVNDVPIYNDQTAALTLTPINVEAGI